jgi:hypothetical protein
MLLHHNMANDAVSLHLLDPALAHWIRTAGVDERRRFALACAATAIDVALRAGDPELQPIARELAALEGRACDRAARGELDRALAVHDYAIGAQLTALRWAHAAVDGFAYTRFRRVALVWYATRALRAALLDDSLTAAGRAAFTTIAATQDEARVLGLTAGDAATTTRGDDDDEGTADAGDDRRGRA